MAVPVLSRCCFSDFTLASSSILSCNWSRWIPAGQPLRASLGGRTRWFRCCGCSSLAGVMGVLSSLVRGLVRGADRMSEFTSKRGSRTHNKGRGSRPAGLRLSSRKFLSVRAMIPEFVVPALEGFCLKPYVSYRAPRGSEPPLTAQSLFEQAVAPRIVEDFREGTFRRDQLEKYGFEPTQEGKLFRLYPKNYAR